MQLNVEQKRLVAAQPSGATLVRGVAGSGKTTVAVYRAEYLMNHYCLDETDRVLLVTYNKTLVKYLRHLYDKVNQTEGEGLASLFGPDKSRVDIYTIDSLIYRYYHDLAAQPRQVLYDKYKRYSVLKQCIAELAQKYKTGVLDPRHATFLLDEIDWIRSCNYMELAEYQTVDRLGRQSLKLAEAPKRLMKNSETRAAIYELMLAFDRRLAAEGLIDAAAMGLEVLGACKETPTPIYTHIIVDESQDLTRVQLEFLLALYKPGEYSSLLFVADTAQSIYPHSWLVRGRSFTSIGLDLTGKGNVLSKNYRTTTQIAQAAYSLIEDIPDIVEDENYVRPLLLDKQGMYPVYRQFASVGAEAAFVAGEIKRQLERHEPGDIVVIARTRVQLEMVQAQLKQSGLPCKLLNERDVSFDEDCIKLLTMHSIKGLEFKVVFVIGLNDDVIPFRSYTDMTEEDMQELTERKLMYVGMTRASEKLFLTSSGKPSRFVANLNPAYLRLDDGSRFSHMYAIRPEEYQFGEKILDLFSKEEKVRQWLLRELQDKYGYPKTLLDVEYKVNNLSRTGSVDICVQVHRDGKLVPYIFCEVKAPGSGIEDALEQVKSYMSNAKHCQFGLASDGLSISVIDKEFNPVADIPGFSQYMLPTGMEKYSFHCFRTGRKFKLIRDCNLSQEVLIESAAGSEMLSGDQLKLVPTYEGIAAGQPIYMQGRSEARYYLPAQWLRGGRECYLLKVQGDSMEGAGIDDGDFVLVQQQDTAENRDIVAVAMDYEATLKRFMRMGNTVLLIPENPKYEPVQLTDNQAKIVGVVVGLLKKESG